jgi:anti-sigma B factor antagonist
MQVSSETVPAGAHRDRTEIPGTIEFAVHVIAADEATVVQVHGDLDCYSAPQLRTVLTELADGPRRVIVDVAGSTFIDSTGLGVLVGSLKRLEQRGGHMVLRSPSPLTARLFEVTGVNKLFEIADAEV